MNPRSLTFRCKQFIARRPILSVIGALGLILVLVILPSHLKKVDEQRTAFYDVKRGNLLISIVEGGNLESVREVSIRSEVQGTARIIHIVPEGTYVKKGDLLVELDSGSAQDEVNQQEISVRKAELAVTNSIEQLAIGRSQTNSDITAATLALDLAKLDLKKFNQGEKAQTQRALQIDVEKIRESLAIDKDRLDWTEKLFAKGFETKNNLEKDRQTYSTSLKDLEQATNALWMWAEFDLKKQLATYQSKVEEAQKDLDRVLAQSRAKISQDQADLLTQERTLDLSKSKLNRDTQNLDGCKIYAPSSGLVVYPVSESRFSSESMIEEGATIRYRQEIIKLPDTSSMKLTIKVHETHIGQVKAGQTAYVVLDAMPDRQFLGKVAKVALLPNNQDRWSNPNLKVYDTEILVDDHLPDSVKPGVSASAEVIITNLDNVLYVPVQAVTTARGKPVVYLADSPSRPTPVEIGLYNTKFIEIKNGLKEGDLVSLSPPLDTQSSDMDGSIIPEGKPASPRQPTLGSAHPVPRESAPAQGALRDHSATASSSAEKRPTGPTDERGGWKVSGEASNAGKAGHEERPVVGDNVGSGTPASSGQREHRSRNRESADGTL